MNKKYTISVLFGVLILAISVALMIRHNSAPFIAKGGGGDCGNGIVDEGEECDDGNRNNNDSCRNNCTSNPNVAVCGNGAVESGEECDDGNDVNTDACIDTCEDASCRDGYVHAGVEECDDGNNDNQDACRNDCTLNSNPVVCGNGIVELGEECDDGNNDNQDSCKNDCTIRTDFTKGSSRRVRDTRARNNSTPFLKRFDIKKIMLAPFLKKADPPVLHGATDKEEINLLHQKEISIAPGFMERVIINLTDSEGEIIEVQGTIEKGRFLIKINPQENFDPEKYHISVVLDSASKETKKASNVHNSPSYPVPEDNENRITREKLKTDAKKKIED